MAAAVAAAVAIWRGETVGFVSNKVTVFLTVERERGGSQEESALCGEET